MTTTLLNKHDLQRVLKVCGKTIDKMRESGHLPPPIQLGDRTRRWRSTEIEKWINDGCPQPPAAEAKPVA